MLDSREFRVGRQAHVRGVELGYTDGAQQCMAYMLPPSLRRCYPMAIRPRRIVPYMLLMSAFKIGNPIEGFIQMIIDDLTGDP